MKNKSLYITVLCISMLVVVLFMCYHYVFRQKKQKPSMPSKRRSISKKKPAEKKPHKEETSG